MQRAFGLFEFDFKEFLSTSAAVVTQVHEEYNPASALFTRNPVLREAAERRHDQLLVAIQAALLESAQTEGSRLAVAVRQLDGVVRAIKGVFALCFPNWLEENEAIRSMLFGLPDRARSYRRRSRVYFGDSTAYARASEQERKTYSDFVDEFDGLSTPPKEILVSQLLSEEVVLELLMGARSASVGLEARLISLRSLLVTLSISASETSKNLMYAARSALVAAEASDDRIPIVRHQLARLRTLRTTHPAAQIQT